jgi:hypothetical protein
MNMKTSLLTLGAVGVLAAGVAIHHSGHCPLMDAKNALTHHAVSGASVAQTPKAVKTDAVVATQLMEAAR